ncbi:protein DpdH [Streptomyces sp. YKOK-I1]
MFDFKRYVCWDVENVISTIQTEAVVASPAVFLSTHTPLSIQRSRINGRSFNSTGESVTEEDVLEDFLNRRTNTRTLLLPVVGESGSGKSHLVRWVRENIEPSDDRKIIYLEKSKTSLRHVIDSLLDDVEDEEIEQIRKDIRHVTGTFTAASLARRLITQLSVSLADLGRESVSGKKRQLVGPRGISLLLQDPLLQEQMLEPDKFIPQFAHHFLSDRESGEERRPRFSLEDLPLSPDAIAGDMAAPTRQIFGILMSRDELQVLAVELLNEQWDKAVQELSGLGGGRLLGAMQKVREIYARQGKEIILLVEDFALIQGVQGDLLDALTETSEREGHAVLAPMRTLMAITSGYFHDLPETAATRIATSTGGFVYNLDIVLEEGTTGTEEIATFVARYLNAARVGRGALESAGSGSVPNKCDDCIVKSLCHDSFGVSVDGFGLYPFNRPSLMRVVHSLAPQENPYAFVPRNVLGSGVIPILTDAYGAIRKGEFPSAFFQENYKSVRGVDQALPNSVSEGIDTHDPLNAKRRRTALEFWADAPTELVNLRQGISEAFSLPDLTINDLHEKRVSPVKSARPIPQKGRSAPPPPQNEPPALQRKIQVVEDWAATGSRLTTDEAKIIRTIISKSVIYREEWLTPPVKPVSLTDTEKSGWYSKNVKSNQVSIEDASSEAMSAGAPIVLKRNPATGEFFKSLLRLSADVVDGVRGKDIVRLASIADAARPAMRDRVVRSMERADKDLIAGLRASLLGAALAGRVVPGMPIDTLYAAAFDVGNEWVRPDVSSRTEAWMERLSAHMQHRSGLVESLLSSLGIGQGAGAVHVLDAARALPLVKEAAAEWDLSVVELPQWVKGAGQPLRSGWQSVVRGQLQELRTLFGEIRERFPKASGPGDRLVQQVSTALQMAKAEGITGPQGSELENRAAAVAEADWNTLSVLEKDLSRVADSLQDLSPEGLLAVVAPIRSPHLREMSDYLTVADSLLDTALAAARMQTQNAVSDAAEQLAALLGEWKQAVDDASTHAEADK